MSAPIRRRILLLMPTTTYRADPFLAAARHLDLEVVIGSDRCHMLADYWHIPLALPFRDPDQAAQEIVAYAREHPVHAVLPLDDRTTVIAAKACRTLNLPHNPPDAAEAARNKRRMRELLWAAGVPCPTFTVYEATEEAPVLAEQMGYPCVLKPLLLSGSRGVIRADTPSEFVEAFRRIHHILYHGPDLPPDTDPDTRRILVEPFIPGQEVAIEGVLTDGRLRVLAVFDKPDPLDGPFFEETIYVTPSRLSASMQRSLTAATETATRAIGLSSGPVHAELRINDAGPWIIEVAGRTIGGLCSRTLRFGLGLSLEELILRHAIGLEIDHIARQAPAAGVMMLPIPSAGILKSVQGLDEARRVDGIEEITITTREDELLVPLPEGSSYLGFIFARAETPNMVENALRKAHRRLRFEIVEQLAVLKAEDKHLNHE